MKKLVAQGNFGRIRGEGVRNGGKRGKGVFLSYHIAENFQALILLSLIHISREDYFLGISYGVFKGQTPCDGERAEHNREQVLEVMYSFQVNDCLLYTSRCV